MNLDFLTSCCRRSLWKQNSYQLPIFVLFYLVLVLSKMHCRVYHHQNGKLYLLWQASYILIITSVLWSSSPSYLQENSLLRHNFLFLNTWSGCNNLNLSGTIIHCFRCLWIYGEMKLSIGSNLVWNLINLTKSFLC